MLSDVEHEATYGSLVVMNISSLGIPLSLMASAVATSVSVEATLALPEAAVGLAWELD
jgi:hypothetical protein